MLIPVAQFPFTTAGNIWTIFNYLSLPLTALCIVGILKLRWLSLGSLIVLVAVFSYSPVFQGIAMGQVSVLLLLLWACGTYFYTKGWYVASSFAFALATAIKLTPLIVIIPLLILKDWKMLRWFAVSLAFLAGVMCLINTPFSLVDYFGHVVPPMSRGILLLTNVSISAAMERLFLAISQGSITSPATDHLSAILILAGKAVAAAILCVACVLTFNRSREMKISDRAMTLALFAVLSACIAPVSWQHGYSVCLLALCLLWAKAVREPIANWHLITLSLCTLALTTQINRFVYDSVERNVTYPITDSFVLLLTPVAGIVLVLIGLAAIHLPNRRKLGGGQIAFDSADCAATQGS